MRIQVTKTALYTFDELPEVAQERAIEKAREWACNDNYWYEFVFDDAKEIAALIGIDIDNIYFSGFWSQGDGAQFTGEYSYRKGALKDVIKYAPLDTKLHDIARDLQDIQRRNFYRLHATVKNSGHYCHEYCTRIDVYCNTEYSSYCPEDTENAVSDLLRDFMRWIYARLEQEYEYQTSDEVLRQTLIDNEYEFTEDGELV